MRAGTPKAAIEWGNGTQGQKIERVTTTGFPHSAAPTERYQGEYGGVRRTTDGVTSQANGGKTTDGEEGTDQVKENGLSPVRVLKNGGSKGRALNKELIDGRLDDVGGKKPRGSSRRQNRARTSSGQRLKRRKIFPATKVGGRRSRKGGHIKMKRMATTGKALPARYNVDHRLLAADLKKWLGAKENRRHKDRKMLASLVVDLEAFDDIGGFPSNFEGDPKVTYEGKNGKLADHAAFIHELVRDERENGWLTMTLKRPDGAYRTSPIFVIPKNTGGRPNGKWRFIHHLSWSPSGLSSVNDDCPQDLAIEYENVADFSEKVVRLQAGGREVRLWKTDLDAAYKLWPFALDHRKRMGFKWLRCDRPVPEYVLKGSEPKAEDLVFYWINRLPFGWRGSVTSFHKVSRALKELHLWEGTPGIKTVVPRDVHDTSVYVDDCCGVALVEWAEAAKRRYHELLGRYRIPWSKKKDDLEGAVDVIKEFLGVTIDTVKRERRLSPERVAEGLRRLKELDGKAYVATRELRSLVGVLSFAGQVCRHARTFLRRCWNALGGSTKRTRWTRLSRGVRADLQWWKAFWSEFNGVVLTPQLGEMRNRDIGLFTDSSLKGWGVVCGGRYMAGAWPATAQGLSINELELYTVALAAAKFGAEWAGKRVIVNVDNMAAVHTINSGAAKSPPLMAAMRELYLHAAKHSFEIVAVRIRTENNIAADAASRGEWKRFFDFVREELNIPCIEQVEPNLDIPAAIKRMQKARLAAVRRARRGQSGDKDGGNGKRRESKR